MNKHNLSENGNKRSIIKKLPYIFFAVFLVIAAVIVITGKKNEKKDEENRRRQAEIVAEKGVTADTAEDAVYEFLQINPDTNRTVIYTFSIYKTEDGQTAGRIEADGDGHYYSILCSVEKNDGADVFAFSSYLEGSEKLTDVESGDILAVFHHKNKAVEWQKFKPLVKGDMPIPNF